MTHKCRECDSELDRREGPLGVSYQCLDLSCGMTYGPEEVEDLPMTGGTEGRVYGGDKNLIHIDDGKRADMGLRLASLLDCRMRREYKGERTLEERVDQKLCSGCYMIAGFNMLLTLADANGQSRTELARSMRNAFDRLMCNPEQGLTEEIEVLLDPCDAS